MPNTGETDCPAECKARRKGSGQSCGGGPAPYRDCIHPVPPPCALAVLVSRYAAVCAI